MWFLWLVIGFLIGLLVGWWYLTRQHRDKIDELTTARRRVEKDFEEEQGAHDATMRQLANAESEVSSANNRASSSETELAGLSRERDDLISKNAETEARLRGLRSDVEGTDSRLAEANQVNKDRAAQVQQAHASQSPRASSDQSRVSELQERIREQDGEIIRLKAELDQTKSRPPPFITDPASDTVNLQTTHPDDLTKIKGVGSVLQERLRKLGIVNFRQIADLTQADIDRIDSVLDFPGRIVRERWVEQAKAIVAGKI